MGRLTKIVLWVFGGIIAVVVAFSVFITFFLTEDRLKTLLIPRAEEHLGRSVSIESIKAGLFSGITIKNAVVKEKDSKKNFISVKKFVLSYKLMPLLEKKLVVSEISLVEPEIFVERDKNGHFNFDTLKFLEHTEAASQKKSPPAPDRAEQAAAIPLALTMDSIRITRAGLEFTDQLNELPRVNGSADLNLKLDMASDMDSLRFSGSLDFLADAVYQGVKTHVTGKSVVDQTEISFDMDVDLENEKARINGRVKNYIKAPDINLDITSQKLDLDHLKSILAGIGAPAAGTTTEKNKDKEQDQGIQGQRIEPAKTIADALPSGLKAAGRISVDESMYKGLLIKDFLVLYKLEKGELNIDELSGRTAGGEVDSRLSLDLNTVMPVYTGSFSVQGLEVVSLAAGIIQKEFNHVSGVLDSEFKYSGKGVALPEIQKSLNLNGDFNLLNGQIKDTFFTRALAAVLKIEDLKTLSFEKIGGSVLVKEGVARLNSEMAGTRVSGSANGDIGLDGRLDLPLVVRLSPELSSRLIERIPLARYLSDDQGFTELNIKLRGSVDNPRPALDLSAARDKGVEALTHKAALEIQKALTRGSEEAKSGEAPEDSENQITETKDPKDQVKDLLKGLFK
ncbi:MAG: AsmA family protein [Thermodesulfobacteriota bacterium]|nr:AsmA family protein [Thermodesulfobacteriota bacterium]